MEDQLGRPLGQGEVAQLIDCEQLVASPTPDRPRRLLLGLRLDQLVGQPRARTAELGSWAQGFPRSANARSTPSSATEAASRSSTTMSARFAPATPSPAPFERAAYLRAR